MAEEKEKMKTGEASNEPGTNHESHASRKKKRSGALKKTLLIVLAVVVVLGGAGALIVNGLLNKMGRINLDEETTLSPEEFWSQIHGTDTSAADSLESAIAADTTAAETEATLPETTEVESATEETERFIALDPNATDVVGIEETTTTAPPTVPWVPPTTKAAPVVSYNWVKAGSLGDEGLINILLVGCDNPSGGYTRSDTIMLLSVNPNSHRASLISFMRDMYVPIHDGYGYSRINHSYQAGGVGFLIQCLQDNFGLHIDGAVRVNFKGFANAVDAIGGVDLSLNAAEVKMMQDYLIDFSGKGVNKSQVHEGNCHLDGNASLAYCRIRKLDNDYNRTARQRKFLTILFNKFKTAGVGTLTNVMNTVLANCDTTMTNGSMAGYAAQILPYAGSMNINTYRLPVQGSFRDVVIGGMQVLQSVQSMNIAALRSYLPW